VFVSPERAVMISPADNSMVENIAGKYLVRKNPQPQNHPVMNNTLNNRKSIDRKKESNSPSAKLSIKKLIPTNNNTNAMNEGKNRNLNE
jgi:hypothetical protein